MLSTLKYQIFPSIAPGLIAGGVLFSYDLFLGNGDKMQSFYDASTLAISYTVIDYISDMIPLSGYSEYLENIKDYVLKPALIGLVYSYVYRKFMVNSFGGYSDFLRLNMINNALIGGGCALISSLISDSLINMLV